MNFNVCPTMGFKKEHSGFLKSGNILLDSFSWEEEDDKLVIKEQTNHKVNDVFNFEGSFEITHSNKKSYQEISLLNSVRYIKYVLDK